MTPDPIILSAGFNQNFQLFRAEDKVLRIDLTGYDLATALDLEWWLAWTPYSFNNVSEVFVKKSLAQGIAVTGTSIDITLAGTDTASLKSNIYYHELKIKLADGSLKVAMTGNVVLRMSLNKEEAVP